MMANVAVDPGKISAPLSAENLLAGDQSRMSAFQRQKRQVHPQPEPIVTTECRPILSCRS